MAFEASSNILLYISNEDPFDHYECILNPSIDNYLSPINSQLKSEVNETDNKLIFSITNTGNSKAQFVKCTVLFFKEGKVVSNTYAFAGTNGTIESGSTERAEIKKTLNKPYDEYKVFIDGHSSASNNSLPTAETNTVEAETEKVSEDLGLNPLLKNQFSIEDVMNGFNTDKIGEYGIVSIDKETLKNITQDQFKEFIDKKVIDSGLNWVSIICSDNTAIIFNGSNHQIATYGECSNDGIVTKPLGYLMLTTDGYEYQEATE